MFRAKFQSAFNERIDLLPLERFLSLLICTVLDPARRVHLFAKRFPCTKCLRAYIHMYKPNKKQEMNEC